MLAKITNDNTGLFFLLQQGASSRVTGNGVIGMADVWYYRIYHYSGKRIILYLFAIIKAHNIICMN